MFHNLPTDYCQNTLHRRPYGGVLPVAGEVQTREVAEGRRRVRERGPIPPTSIRPRITDVHRKTTCWTGPLHHARQGKRSRNLYWIMKCIVKRIRVELRIVYCELTLSKKLLLAEPREQLVMLLEFSSSKLGATRHTSDKSREATRSWVELRVMASWPSCSSYL